jgi:hypothetical protein
VLRWQPTGGEHLLIGFACVRGQLFERVNSSRDLDRLGELVRLDVTRASKVTVLSDIAGTSLEQGRRPRPYASLRGLCASMLNNIRRNSYGSQLNRATTRATRPTVAIWSR